MTRPVLSSIVLFLFVALTPHLWVPVLRTVIREIAAAAEPHEEEENPRPRAKGKPLRTRHPRTRTETWQAGEGSWSKRRRVNTAWDGGRGLRALPPADEPKTPTGPRAIGTGRRRSA